MGDQASKARKANGCLFLKKCVQSVTKIGRKIDPKFLDSVILTFYFWVPKCPLQQLLTN